MFVKGHKHSTTWYAAVSKPRPQYVKEAVSKAQKNRKHTKQEGFQKGHEPIEGTEKTRFVKGQIPWNYGTKGQRIDASRLKYRTYKSNAKKRGIDFEITLEDMRGFLAKPCFYCGERATGIDRVDNDGGYIEGNMVSCCGVCNHMKNNLTKEQFMNKCKQIISITGYEI